MAIIKSKTLDITNDGQVKNELQTDTIYLTIGYPVNYFRTTRDNQLRSALEYKLRGIIDSLPNPPLNHLTIWHPAMTVSELRFLRGPRGEDLLEDLRPDIRRLRA